MELSFEMLVYCSTLRKDQYAQLQDVSRWQPGVVDIAVVEEGVWVSVEERLKFAEDLLRLSQQLCPADVSRVDEISARSALSRAYYSIHHAIRALVLFEERGDADGHQESIKALCNLVGRVPALRQKLGEQHQLKRELEEVLYRRHLADYYPYGASVPVEPPLNFTTAAQEAMLLASRVLEKAREYITQKKEGVI